MKNLFTVLFVLVTTLNAKADEYILNKTFVGTCLNYALATGHAEEFSYVVNFISEDNVETLTLNLERYFDLSQASSQQTIISYKLNISEAKFLDGALLIDDLIEQHKITARCLYVK